MIFHVLLNLSNNLRKSDIMGGFLSILSLFATSLINSISQEHKFYLSYGIKIILKSHFWHKKVNILLLCTQRCYVRHFITLAKSVNH